MSTRSHLRTLSLTLFLSACLPMAASATDTIPVETWLRALAAQQKFHLVIGVGIGSTLVSPPEVVNPQTIGDTLAKAGVPFGFTTSKDGTKILVLQLGIDALSKSVGIADGAGSGTASDSSFPDSRASERGLTGDGSDPSVTPSATKEDPDDPRLKSRPALPPQADPDDPIEALIDRSIKPLPKQFDLNDPDEAQIDPTRKPLPPQIDYTDPDEHRRPPVETVVPAAVTPVKPVPAAPKKTGKSAA